MIYMDEHIRLTPPKHKNHVTDMERWMPGLAAGDALASSLNPVVYTSQDGSPGAPEIA